MDVIHDKSRDKDGMYVFCFMDVLPVLVSRHVMHLCGIYVLLV